jgi:sialic acid synthase SpsE
MNRDFLTMPELSHVEANLDRWIFETQKAYETAISEYIKFKEAYTESEITYDKKFAEEIAKRAGAGEKVTIIKELAKVECENEYRKMKKLEAQKKKYTMWITAFENRINMLKYLMRRKMDTRG